MILSKQIVEARFDDEHQSWAVVGSLIWQGEMKEGCKEIVAGYGPYVTGFISSYYLTGRPNTWSITCGFYADYDDTFASGVIKVLRENGWEWS